ncbi:MAG: ATP-binding protein [Actinomycetota bacterium]
MGSFHELPRNARRLIIGFAVLASAVIVIQAPEIRMWTAQEALAAALLALAAALTEQFTVSITHRTETENFSVTDALWVPALILAPGSVLIVSVLIGTVAGHAFRRWAWYKVVFNASQFVLAITAAQAVFHLFDLPPEFSLLTWVACVLAMSLYFTMNEVAVALIISQVEEVSIRKVLLLPGGLNLLHAAGNLTIGMLAALVWRAGLVGLPLLIAPVVLSFFAYKGWLQNKREQEERRERDRMSMLYEAGRALFGPLDGAFDFRPFLQLVRRVLDAAGAELVLREGTELHLYGSESGLYLSVPDPSEHGDPAAYVGARPGLSTHLSSISDETGVVGVLAAHRATAFSAAEQAMVDALASQVAARHQNQQLFDETLEQRGHLADVVGSSSDGIFVLSTARSVLSWNPAMERISGFLADEAVGRPIAEVLVVSGSEDDEGGAPTGLDWEATGPEDALILRRDGSERWIRYTRSSMPDREGTPASLVVTARDVTAELEAERLKSDFIATVSHELRTPLTPLKGLLHSLDRGLIEDTPETRREYHRIMLRQADRLERLINDLLDASRIEAGGLKMQSQPLEVGDALAHEIGEASALMNGREVRFERPDDPVWIQGDRFRLGQIVSNLLVNAAKYSSPGTPVMVELEEHPDGAIISIHDEGEGIPLVEQERVFERFYRTGGVRTNTTGGVGLGLYIARQLTEAMGGTLTLRSRLGEGSTFSLFLPGLATGSTGSRGVGSDEDASDPAVPSSVPVATSAPTV